jgi:hypothetical protein
LIIGRTINNTFNQFIKEKRYLKNYSQHTLSYPGYCFKALCKGKISNTLMAPGRKNRRTTAIAISPDPHSDSSCLSIKLPAERLAPKSDEFPQPSLEVCLS